MVLFKVGVSCYAAVLSDAKLKGFSRSFCTIYVHLLLSVDQLEMSFYRFYMF